MTNIPGTALTVYPLCLGGNVFGWSANESQSEGVLDYFAAAGGNFIDTADVYSEWAPGNRGGESEQLIGKWMRKRNNRASMIIATKVAKLSRRQGLSAKNIVAACNDSLARLQTDYIDLYYAHEDDPSIPMQESLEAFDSLVRGGKVRYIACSNFTAARLDEALKISGTLGYSRYSLVQDNYNLLDRSDYESALRGVVEAHGLSILPYYSLARGFLSGKYRPGTAVDSVRAGGVEQYRNERGWRILSVVESVAQSHATSMSAVALAWLRAQPTVSVPIASARTVEQLKEVLPVIELSAEELARLG